MVSGLVLAAPFLLAAGSLGLETLARRRDTRRYPAPGKRFDIGGHGLHARVLGRGETVIVLEADAGAWCSHWGSLPEKLSNLATVVAYDRAGLGWSAAGPGPRTPDCLASELRQLLRVVAPDRPLLLVAHGAGARVTGAFAQRYPHEVAGLVLLDGEHPSLRGILAEELLPSPALSCRALRGLDLAGRVGLLRALGYTPLGDREEESLPTSTRAVIRAVGPRSLGATTAEARDAGWPSLPHLEVPLRALVAEESLPTSGTPARFPRAAYNRAWREASARWGQLSDRARCETVAGDHFFPLHAPHHAVDAVRAVLQATRA